MRIKKISILSVIIVFCFVGIFTTNFLNAQETNEDNQNFLNENVDSDAVDFILSDELALVATDVSQAVSAPELSTDKADYAPTEKVTIWGSLFQAFQDLVLKIFGSFPDGSQPVTHEADVTADDQGNFTYEYQLDGTYRPDYTVTASDATSGEELAEVTFTDAAQNFYGWNVSSRTPEYPDWTGSWDKGNLGKNWREGDWVSYVLVLDGYEGTVLPEIDIRFDFRQGSSGGILADLARNFSYKIQPSYGGSGNPGTDVTPANFDTWCDGTFTPSIINRSWPPGTTENQADPGAFAFWRLTSNDAFADSVPAGESVVIYFEMHLARTFVWSNGLEYQYASGLTSTLGGDRYSLPTTNWTATHLGSGFVTGASGHLILEATGIGAKTIPIPIPPVPTSEIRGTKYNDVNGNGNRDGGEQGLPNWTINISTTVEDITFTDSTTTGSDGSYAFLDLISETYTISEVFQDDWTQTAPSSPGTHSVTLEEDQIVTGKDFGNRISQGTIELKKVWLGTGGQTTLNIGTTAGASDVKNQLTGVAGGAPLTTGQNTVIPGTYYMLETDGLTDYTIAPLSCFNDENNNGTNDGELAVTVGLSDSVAVGNNEHVICTYTNTRKTGKIELQKDFIGTAENVTIKIGTSQNGSETDLQVLSADGTTDENIVNTGLYFVSETLTTPANYTSSLTCHNDINHNNVVDSGDTLHTVDVNTGEVAVGFNDDVICVYTNTRKQGTVELKKVWSGTAGNTTLNIGTSAGGSQIDTEIINGADGTTGTNTVNTGTYYVSEDISMLSNYDTSLACTDNGEPVTPGANNSLVVSSNHTVICTYTNTRQTGKIQLDKDFIGTPESVDIKIGTSQNGSQVDSATLSGDGTTGENIVDTGAYYVSETLTIPSNYNVLLECFNDVNNSNTIDGGDTSHAVNTGTGAVAVGNNEDVICRYTNTRQQGTVIVKKVMVGGEDTFTYSGTSSGSISANNGTIQSTVDTGQYTSIEDTKAGWDLTSIVCNDSNSAIPSSGDIGSRTATFNVEANETVTCTFTNTKLGSISGMKFEDHDGNGINDGSDHGLETWTISLSGDKTDSKTTDVNGAYSFTDLLPGTYHICETLKADWTQTAPTSGSNCDGGTLGYTVILSAGDNVIDKDFGNFELFEISGKKFSDLNADGTRTNETTDPNLPGWTIKLDLVGTTNPPYCESGYVGYPAAVNGEYCEVQTNTYGNYKFINLGPGQYIISEELQGGWYQTAPTSSTGLGGQDDGTYIINSSSGTNRTGRNFGNVELGTIIVEKQTIPDQASGDFTFTGNAAGTISDDGQITVHSLLPGTYTSIETGLPTGWALTEILCNDNDSIGDLGTYTAIFNLQAGEIITCVFTNNKPAAQIDLDPLTATNKIGDDHVINANVQVQNGNGVYGPADDGTLVTFSLLNNNAGATFVGGNTCLTTGGLCSVDINSTQTGSVNIHAVSAPVVLGITLPVATGTGENSADAQKDYVDAQIQITGDSTNEVGVDHTFTVTVKKDLGDGAGLVIAQGETVIDSISGTGTISGGTCSSGITDANGQCTIIVSSATTGVGTVHATVTVTIDNVLITRATSDGLSGDSPDTHKTWVDANIQIDPPTATNKIGDQHTLTAHVNVNDGSGFANAPNDTIINFVIVSGPGSLPVLSCSTSGDTGSCSVILLSAMTGTTVVNASTAVLVEGVTLNRSTGDGKVGDSDNAQKTWADLQIIIDQNSANEVNHPHTFTVTVNSDPGTGTFGPVSGATVTPSITGIGSLTGTGTCETGTTDGSGQCTIIVNSSIAGVGTVGATTTVNVGGVSITRSLGDGLSGDSAKAIKTWVDAKISIGEDGVNEIGKPHTFTGHVDVNNGLGWANAPAGTQINFAIVSGPGSLSPSSCSTIGTTGSCTVDLTSATVGTTTVSATVNEIDVGGVLLTRTTNGLAGNSGHAVKKWVDAYITITPERDTNPIHSAHDFTVTVTQIPGTAIPATTANITTNVTPTPNVTNTTTCGATVPFVGNVATCTITINSSVPGAFEAIASATMTVGGVVLTRITDGLANNSVPAVKTYEAGSLEITKIIAGLDDVVNKSSISEDFTVTVTGCPTCSYPAGIDITFHLVDGVLQTPASVTLSPLIPGEYTVTEADAGAEWSEVVATSPVTVVANVTAKVAVTNTYIPGSLEVTKIVNIGGYLIPNGVDLDFTINVTGPSYLTPGTTLTFNVVNGIVSGPQTLSNLIPGTYTVTETGVDTVTWTVTGGGSVIVNAGLPAAQSTVTNTLKQPHTTATLSSSPTEIVNGGTVMLTITDINDGFVPLTNPSVVLTYGTTTVIFTKTLPVGAFVVGGDSNNNDIMDIGETWTWNYQLILTETTTFEINGHGFDPLGNDISPENGYTAEYKKIDVVVVDAKITLDPLEETNNVNDPHTVIVTVMKDPGTGSVSASGEHVDFTLTDSGATAVLDATGSTCDEAGSNTDVNGQCKIVFTSATPGTVTIHATVDLTVNTVLLHRETDGSHGSTQDAIKTYVAGKIIVIKQTLPDGSSQSFEFDPSWSITNFNLTDGQQKDSGWLAPGDYSVIETSIPDGWKLISATCDGQGNTPNDITLAAGETVTCTFTNTTYVEVNGMKFQDTDADRIKDTLEPGLENWRIVAMQEVDEINVDSKGDIFTSVALDSGQKYMIRVEGTYDAADSIIADAKYSSRLPNTFWTDYVQNHASYGLNLLNLKEDGAFPDWGDFNPDHIYWLPITGTGATIDFQIYDIAPSNNSGSLNVKIYKVIDEDMTDVNGNYSIELLGYSGNIIIAEETQAGWTQTAPVSGYHTVSASGGTVDNKDFGNTKLGMISGYKFEDVNGNGVWDEGEPALADWKINLTGPIMFGSLITDLNGYYEFPNLVFGDYSVTETGKTGWTQTTINPSTITVGFGINFENNNFGNFKDVTITAYKFDDKDGDGIKDVEDTPIAGWEITLDGSNTKSTDVDGMVSWIVKTGGDYIVTEEEQIGWVNTTPLFVTFDGIKSGDTPDFAIFLNAKLAKLTIVKDSDPNDTQDFDFTRSFGEEFTLDDDEGVQYGEDDTYQNNVLFNNLMPNLDYTVTEDTLPNPYWTFVGVSCINNVTQTVYPSVVSGQSVTVNLAPGADITCTFTNHKDSPTRTLGFWKTHTDYTSEIFTTYFNSVGGMLIGDGITHVAGRITNVQSSDNSELFGAYYANIANKTTLAGKGKKTEKRSSTDKARMQLLQQLVTAKLNCAAFGCQSSIQTTITEADVAYAADDKTDILNYAGLLDEFNNSGDTIILIGTPGKATPKVSKLYANLAFWDTP